MDKHSGSEDCKNSESNDGFQQQENDGMDESKDNESLGESCDSSPRIYRGHDVVNRYKESKFGILQNRLKSVLERQKTLPMKTIKPLKNIRYFCFWLTKNIFLGGIQGRIKSLLARQTVLNTRYRSGKWTQST